MAKRHEFPAHTVARALVAREAGATRPQAGALVGVAARTVRYWEEHPRGSVTDDILSKERKRLQAKVWGLVDLSMEAVSAKLGELSAMEATLIAAVAHELALELEAVSYEAKGREAVAAIYAASAGDDP